MSAATRLARATDGFRGGEGGGGTIIRSVLYELEAEVAPEFEAVLPANVEAELPEPIEAELPEPIDAELD